MDSVSRPEFGRIFIRVDMEVGLGGATTGTEIEDRMNRAAYLKRRKAKSLRLLGEVGKGLVSELGPKRAREFDRQIAFLKAGINRALAARMKYDAEQLNKLVEHDFAGRAIYEANKYPNGEIAQTLIYGVASPRMLAQRRAQTRAGRGISAEARQRRVGLIRRLGG